jgi:hypothetical protein
MKLIQTFHALTDHLPDFGKMVMQTSAADHFAGSNKMVGGGQLPKDTR